MMRIYETKTAQQTSLRRPAWDELAIPHPLLDRIEALFGERITPEEAVRRILAAAPAGGDAALVDWAQRVDGVTPPALIVPRAAIEAAYDHVAPAVIDAMRVAIA